MSFDVDLHTKFDQKHYEFIAGFLKEGLKKTKSSRKKQRGGKKVNPSDDGSLVDFQFFTQGSFKALSEIKPRFVVKSSALLEVLDKILFAEPKSPPKKLAAINIQANSPSCLHERLRVIRMQRLHFPSEELLSEYNSIVKEISDRLVRVRSKIKKLLSYVSYQLKLAYLTSNGKTTGVGVFNTQLKYLSEASYGEEDAATIVPAYAFYRNKNLQSPNYDNQNHFHSHRGFGYSYS